MTKFEDEALDLLIRYAWPGNIRELQNVIERAVVLAEGETITVADLPVDLQNAEAPVERTATSHVSRSGDLRMIGNMPGEDDDPLAERRKLIEALEKCGGNKARAARLLGLARSTYFSKLKKHGLADADGNLAQIKRLPR
jgi:DNA-binding NtrC family response regulator